jgi:hypothetical protein
MAAIGSCGLPLERAASRGHLVDTVPSAKMSVRVRRCPSMSAMYWNVPTTLLVSAAPGMERRLTATTDPSPGRAARPVEQLRPAGQHHVAGLQVAVHDATRWAASSACAICAPSFSTPRAAAALGERCASDSPLDQLEHKVQLLATDGRAADVVDRAGWLSADTLFARARSARNCGLPASAAAADGGDVPVELSVARAVDPPMPPAPSGAGPTGRGVDAASGRRAGTAHGWGTVTQHRGPSPASSTLPGARAGWRTPSSKSGRTPAGPRSGSRGRCGEGVLVAMWPGGHQLPKAWLGSVTMIWRKPCSCRRRRE